jgi:hypothetical protein
VYAKRTWWESFVKRAFGALRLATGRSTMLHMTKRDEPIERVMLNLPASVSDALRQAAQTEQRSVSMMGRLVLEQWKAERERQQGKAA